MTKVERWPLKVFLCHARADKQKVRELYRSLRKRGIQPWLDAEDLVAGQDWRVEIPKAIRASDAIIIFLSKNSINTEGFVQTEISFALEKALEIPPGRIFIIPARFEDCEVPDRLERFQWVDLFEEGGFRKLMRALRTRAGQLERSTVQVPEVHEPSLNNASTSAGDGNDQELQLRNLESQAIKAELTGDIRNARRIWYEIKRIDPLFPRVDTKLGELERELAEMARKEKAQREASEENARRETAEHRTAQIIALKRFISKTEPFIRIGGVLGIILALFWVGSWAMPQFFSPFPTAKASLTARPTGTIALSSSTVASTRTKQPSATPTTLITLTPTALPIEFTDAKGAQMVLVTAGEFTMGSETYADEKPVRKVYLDAFYMDLYEVTNSLYKACVDAGGCIPPQVTKSHTRSSYYGNPEFNDYPVIYVDWSQAQTYCEWRGAELPTEAQWEKAARGTDERTYPWGEGIDCNRANYCEAGSDTTKVGSYESGKSPYGIYDLAGNVWEWTADWYSEDYYQISPSHNPVGPNTGQYRTLRGGSWYFSVWDLRAVKRFPSTPDTNYDGIGFRCARDAGP